MRGSPCGSKYDFGEQARPRRLARFKLLRLRGQRIAFVGRLLACEPRAEQLLQRSFIQYSGYSTAMIQFTPKTV